MFNKIELNKYKLINCNSYVAIYLPKHPKAMSNGLVYAHIIAAENKLERYLEKEECVHHIDGCKTNNELNNLMIFASIADHSCYHDCIKNNLNFELKYIKGIYYCKQLNYNNKLFCPICKSRKTLIAKLCYSCYEKEKRKNIPSRIILKNDIRNLSFVAIGNKYNVSDKAIVKWCKYYNFPYRKIDIKKYSDIEWNLI